MEWLDEAFVLSSKPHGETACIVALLTAEHGVHAGLVSGGQGQKTASILQAGNQVKARWRARLLDHLGNYSLDLLTSYPAGWMDDAEVLGLIASCAAVTEAALPERQPMGGVYAAFEALMSLTDPSLWAPAYVKWEVGLLRALGFGLDFTCCAVTGSADDLTHVSPRTGRAVCRAEAAPYREKLLILPAFLAGGGSTDAQDIMQGLALTGHFLSRHVFANPPTRHLVPQSGELPLARQRIYEFYQRRVEKELG